MLTEIEREALAECGFNIYSIRNLIKRFPDSKEDFYQAIKSSIYGYTGFNPHHLKEFVSIFHEHNEQIYRGRICFFNNYVGGDIYKLKPLIEVFPKHDKELLKKFQTTYRSAYLFSVEDVLSLNDEKDQLKAEDETECCFRF